MSFQELLATVTKMQEAEDAQLAKSQDAAEDQADDKIAAAASDGEDATDTDTTTDAADDVDGAGDDAGDDDAADDDEVLGKSLSFTLEDGTVIEAHDGAELVKSLIERTDTLETATAQVLGSTIDLLKSQSTRLDKQDELIKSQAALIKSQGEQIAKLAGSGRGRTSILSVTEKLSSTELTKSQAAKEPQLTGREILAKAQAAMAAGKITGMDAVRIETSVNQGVPLSQTDLAKLA